MLRLYDWECTRCKTRQEHLVSVPNKQRSKNTAKHHCKTCGKETKQERLISLTAPYLGEKIRNPVVGGGRFDTAGLRKPPRLPQLPGQQEHNKKCAEALNNLPATATREDARHAVIEASKDGPSCGDYATLFATKEYAETEKERTKVIKENKQKQKRLAALKRGENVNFRRDKCAGDPKI